MKPFGSRNRARTPGDGNAQSAGGDAQASHRLTLELQRAEKFAAMLAHSRVSNVIEVSDYLAGMYICNWEHLSEYWAENDRENVEDLLRKICQISPQRWHAWIELYDQQRHEKVAPRYRVFRRRKNEEPGARPLQSSDALATILKQAEQIAPAYDRKEGRSLPILNTECVLLSMVRSLGSEISRKLALSGLDVARLEKEVLLPRRRPRV
jgi:hypothetical protein